MLIIKLASLNLSNIALMSETLLLKSWRINDEVLQINKYISFQVSMNYLHHAAGCGGVLYTKRRDFKVDQRCAAQHT